MTTTGTVVDENNNSLMMNPWYNARELDTFRRQARDACLQLRALVVSRTTATTGSPAATATMAYNDETRGLESRICTERARRRYLVRRCIVRAQKKLCPDRLADLAQRCSHWARVLAYEEAARDCQRAYYQPTEKRTIPTATKGNSIDSTTTPIITRTSLKRSFSASRPDSVTSRQFCCDSNIGENAGQNKRARQ